MGTVDFILRKSKIKTGSITVVFWNENNNESQFSLGSVTDSFFFCNYDLKPIVLCRLIAFASLSKNPTLDIGNAIKLQAEAKEIR